MGGAGARAPTPATTTSCRPRSARSRPSPTASRAPSRRAPWRIPTASRGGCRSGRHARDASASGDGTSTACRSARRPTRCSTRQRDLLDRLPRRRPGGGLGDAGGPRPDERRAGGGRQRTGPRPRRGPHVPHVAAQRRRRQLPRAHGPAGPSCTSTSWACSARTCWWPTRVHLDDDEIDVVVRTRHRGRVVPVGVPAAGAGLHRPPAGTASCCARGAPRRARLRRRERRRRGRHPARRHAVRRSGPRPRDGPVRVHRPRRRWRWPRSAAHEAIGKGDAIGSIEVGKQADLVVHDRRGPQFVPRSTDPVLQLMWASDGRSVSDV